MSRDTFIFCFAHFDNNTILINICFSTLLNLICGSILPQRKTYTYVSPTLTHFSPDFRVAWNFPYRYSPLHHKLSQLYNTLDRDSDVQRKNIVFLDRSMAPRPTARQPTGYFDRHFSCQKKNKKIRYILFIFFLFFFALLCRAIGLVLLNECRRT